ncbi:hypothetical protein F991_01460 [Acinetobacter sp. CIP-A165]|uniref:hypothetical protein n=1 Tax=Acinetobacter sp. CIP-A165 TaxID=40373 RepID=UPI0002D04042|nr:hypothetical protein [Acinetobacter sp. CIP-A165]ENU30675.1 hypothetical protein F991_01460 [Acinetobacter sp. CIP-A165]
MKYIFVVPSNVNNKTLRYKIDNRLANTDMKIIGFSEKKIGVYTPNTANKLVNRFIISKSKPKLLKVGETIEYPLDINEQLITSGQSISIDFELAGLNDLFTIKTYFKNAALNTNFELSHSYITNGLRINIKNKSTGELTLPANTIGIKVKEF